MPNHFSDVPQLLGEHCDDPLILSVQSEQPAIAARVALYLGQACPADVQGTDLAFLREVAGRDGFDVDAALERAATSVWSRSTLDRPYPNLERS